MVMSGADNRFASINQEPFMKRRKHSVESLAASRRQFLKSSAYVAGAGVWVAAMPGGKAFAEQGANEKLNVACIGVGGKGDSDSEQVSKHANVVGICDID